jgi:hypothetical protein
MLDPALWFYDAGIEHPDEWQVAAMRSESKRQIWNIHRQGGKTVTAAIKALAAATTTSNSPVLVISASLRQSQELVRNCHALHAKIPGLPRVISDSALRMEFENRSRIISLPPNPATVRGYSTSPLILLDEASQIPDDVIAACVPATAVGHGSIIALSTPFGQRGFFYEWWVNGGPAWERTQVTVDQCSRITPDFLSQQRAEMSEQEYQSEYMCAFVENDAQMFPTEIINAAFSDDILPIWN